MVFLKDIRPRWLPKETPEHPKVRARARRQKGVNSTEAGKGGFQSGKYSYIYICYMYIRIYICIYIYCNGINTYHCHHCLAHCTYAFPKILRGSSANWGVSCRPLTGLSNLTIPSFWCSGSRRIQVRSRGETSTFAGFPVKMYQCDILHQSILLEIKPDI